MNLAPTSILPRNEQCIAVNTRHVAIAAIAAVYRPDFAGAHWPHHVARSILGWLAGLFLFAAATMMPLASATALSFLSPVVTMVCAIVMLSERVGIWRWSAAAIALTGLVPAIHTDPRLAVAQDVEIGEGHLGPAEQ